MLNSRYFNIVIANQGKLQVLMLAIKNKGDEWR